MWQKTDKGEKVVYGSELHKVLEVKSPYREWYQRRFKDCDAVEILDFQGVEISTPSRPWSWRITSLPTGRSGPLRCRRKMTSRRA
ncbi:MAG: antA/AntB antirepressor family protein [Blautia sp.]|nr:antA/AntB antirepressor family protein [Blautia sp.]